MLGEIDTDFAYVRPEDFGQDRGNLQKNQDKILKKYFHSFKIQKIKKLKGQKFKKLDINLKK